MKKMYAKIVAFIFCAFAWGGFAQNLAGVNLSVELQGIQSITINESQNNVGISLTNASEYRNGKSVQQPDHIKITSSSNYEIKVSAASNLLSDASSIDIGTVTLTPSLGSIGTASADVISLNSVALSLGDTTLVQSSNGDAQRSFNINYKVSGGEAYLNKPVGMYSTLVTYTILAP